MTELSAHVTARASATPMSQEPALKPAVLEQSLVPGAKLVVSSMGFAFTMTTTIKMCTVIVGLVVMRSLGKAKEVGAGF